MLDLKFRPYNILYISCLVMLYSLGSENGDRINNSVGTYILLLPQEQMVGLGHAPVKLKICCSLTLHFEIEVPCFEQNTIYFYHQYLDVFEYYIFHYMGYGHNNKSCTHHFEENYIFFSLAS